MASIFQILNSPESGDTFCTSKKPQKSFLRFLSLSIKCSILGWNWTLGGRPEKLKFRKLTKNMFGPREIAQNEILTWFDVRWKAEELSFSTHQKSCKNFNFRPFSGRIPARIDHVAIPAGIVPEVAGTRFQVVGGVRTYPKCLQPTFQGHIRAQQPTFT